MADEPTIIADAEVAENTGVRVPRAETKLLPESTDLTTPPAQVGCLHDLAQNIICPSTAPKVFGEIIGAVLFLRGGVMAGFYRPRQTTYEEQQRNRKETALTQAADYILHLPKINQEQYKNEHENRQYHHVSKKSRRKIKHPYSAVPYTPPIPDDKLSHLQSCAIVPVAPRPSNGQVERTECGKTASAPLHTRRYTRKR